MRTRVVSVPSMLSTIAFMLNNRWLKSLLCTLMLVYCLPLQAQIAILPVLQDYAGNGTNGYTGDGGVATSAELHTPYGMTFDASGNMYVVDKANNVVRKITAAGIITTVAGTGTAGNTGDGGAATSATLSAPTSVAVDASGNIYIADTGNNRIRKVTASTGVISAMAGNGTAGFSGDGGTATSAELHSPSGLALDPSGNLYVSDASNNRIRKVASGVISTVAGGGSSGIGDGGAATSAQLSGPSSVAFDSSGNLYIADAGHSRIRVVNNTSGTISTITGGLHSGYSGDGGAASSALLDDPTGVAVDAVGNIYIADSINGIIREVNTSGIINTIAGTPNPDGDPPGILDLNEPAANNYLATPHNVTVDAFGNVYVTANVGNRVLQVGSGLNFPTTAVGSSSSARNIFLTVGTGTFTSITAPVSQGGHQEYNVTTSCAVDSCTVSVSFNPAYAGERAVPLQVVTSADGNANFGLTGIGTTSQAAFAPGIISTVAGDGSQGHSGDGGAATSAELTLPSSVVVDAAGNFYIADLAESVVREVSASGIITTVAGGGTSGLGDNGAATSAELNGPWWLALDAAGNLYIGDQYDNRVRKVTAATGIITTVAGNGTGSSDTGDGGLADSAELEGVDGVALDLAGNLYIATGAHVRKVTAATGIITTLASEVGNGLAVDAAGNLYIAETLNHEVRKIAAGTGAVTTVVGTGTLGESGDGGLATSAELTNVYGVVLDAAGNLYLSGPTIRKVDVSGIITSIAGNGTPGYSGDGGSATAAELDTPIGVALDTTGNVYIADINASVVRKVTVNESVLTYPTSTSVGFNDSADGAGVVTVYNTGNSSLTFSVPSSGNNASISSGFAYDIASTCPQLSTISSPYTLAAGHDCTYAVDFIPTVIGHNAGTLTLTDSSLNSPGSTQSAVLSGTGH